MADGVITLSNDHFRWYLDAVEKYGGNVDEARIYASQWVIVAEDPEKVWAEGVGERALFQINEYIAWGSFEGPDQPAQFDSPQALLDAGIYRLMDASLRSRTWWRSRTACPQVRDFHYWAQLPGETVESGSERVQYLADKVIPEVTRRLAKETSRAAGLKVQDVKRGRAHTRPRFTCGLPEDHAAVDQDRLPGHVAPLRDWPDRTRNRRRRRGSRRGRGRWSRRTAANVAPRSAPVCRENSESTVSHIGVSTTPGQ